ncbi:DNA-processing protein DprA [Salinithrix halophila]|uniref:DNA-processing protein DprA n=1 Tax=Salinithrix halophila TaxID=1485204 RepID=UPI0036D2307A
MTAWGARDGLVALHQIQGVGWHTIDALLRAGWDPARPLEASGHALERVQWRRKEVPGSIRKKWTAPFVRKVQEELARRTIQTLTVWDDDYPDRLRELPQPPWVLYLKGDPSLLTHPCLAVVGTRKPTSYGKQATAKLAAETASRGWTIVSGLAAGIDGEAHRAVLQRGGRTAAVLGCGVDVVYPKHHRSLYEQLVAEGVVLSEAPPGVAPRPGLFPQRNRIISGLSHGVLVVEAAERSGSLITADCGMEQGREVFAVPGPITSSQSMGSNRLIQQGAKCVLTSVDILEEFPHIPELPREDIREEEPEELSEEESQVFRFFEEGPLSLEELTTCAGIPLGDLHRLLLALQVKKRLRQLPGARFERV